MGWEGTIIRLGVAVALGAVIGFERQWRQRMAGLRTTALVALGAASFVALQALEPGGALGGIAAQVVSGIGFIGGGVILREGLNIRGLNTAATLWCSAAVGVLAGAGFLVESAIAAGFVVMTNLFLRPLVRLINRQPALPANAEADYLMSVTCRGEEEARVRALLLQGVTGGGLGLRQLDSTNVEGTGSVLVTATLHAASRSDAVIEQIVGRLSLESAVTAAKWQVQEVAE